MVPTNMKNINTEEYEITRINLKKFLEDQFSIEIEELIDSQSLDDFGIDADDIYELIIKLSKEFSFDLSNFNKEKYINNEPNFLTSLYSMINYIFKTDYNEKYVEPITTRMLILSILNKRWIF